MSENKLDWFTTDEVAEKLNVERKVVYYWITEGKLKAFKIGKYYKIPKSSLREFIAKDSTVDDETLEAMYQKLST